MGEYDTLTANEQDTIKSDSKERLLAYLLIINSSNTSTHESVKNNLLEAFIAKRDEYPATRSDAIALLNKYNKQKPPPTAASEGTAFTQKGKKGAGEKKRMRQKGMRRVVIKTKRTSSLTRNASYVERRGTA